MGGGLGEDDDGDKKIALTASFCSSPRSVVHCARHQVKIAWRGKILCTICLTSFDCFLKKKNLRSRQ